MSYSFHSYRVPSNSQKLNIVESNGLQRDMKGLPEILISFILFIQLLQPTQSCSQSITLNSYSLIQELASDSLWGRSIQKNGKQIALDHIIHFLDSQTNKPLHINRMLHDTILVHFTKKIELKVNEVKELNVLHDFAPHAGSPSFSGKAKVISLNKLNESKLYSPFFLYAKSVEFSEIRAELSRLMNLGMKGLFLEQESILYQPQIESLPFPILFIKPKRIHSNDVLEINLITAQESYPIENVIIQDTSSHCIESKVTLMAHYDHLGTLSDSLIFNGANDNASGIALAVELFVSFVNRNKPIQLILTDAEEIGLLGSKLLINNDQVFPIHYLINLDMVASGDGSFGVVGIDTTTTAFKILKQFADSTHASLKVRPNSPNSDHYWFLSSGIDGFYFYSNNGNQPYHSINDDFSSLNYTIYYQAYTILESFIEKFFYK
jgi:hypothetical protein